MVLKDATESEEGNRRSILGTGTPIPSVELIMWVLVDGGFNALGCMAQIFGLCRCKLLLGEA